MERRDFLSAGVAAGIGMLAAPALAQVDAAALRATLVMADEPVDPLTPTAAKETLSAKDAPKGPQKLVIAGRIGAKGMEPFLENKASFVLQEIPADDHAGKAGHDADNCPFCKKRSANAPMVAVQFVGAEAEPFEGAGPEVLHQHVGVGDEAAEQLHVGVGLQVECDGALVAAHHLPPQPFPIAWVAPCEVAQAVAAIGTFHLDDVGTEVGEVPGTVRAGQHRGDVDHLDVVQCVHQSSTLKPCGNAERPVRARIIAMASPRRVRMSRTTALVSG